MNKFEAPNPTTLSISTETANSILIDNLKDMIRLLEGECSGFKKWVLTQSRNDTYWHKRDKENQEMLVHMHAVLKFYGG